jgi:BON domain
MARPLRSGIGLIVLALLWAAPSRLGAQQNPGQDQAQPPDQSQPQDQTQNQNQAQPQVSDQEIVDNINAKLFADSALKTQDIRVSCQQGVVVLRGSVDTQLEKAAVDRIASIEPGVQKVIDSLALGSGSGPAAASASSPAQSPGITIPSGTVVTIRTIDSIDSSKNQTGQEFSATVDAPVASGSQVVIPQGSGARLRLAASQDSGRIEGSAELELELISVTVNGTRYPVQSGYYQQHGANRGRRTGTAAGGGAVLGALIGAIAGGGKGAAIGAGSGAAIGAGTSVAMKGSNIKVPPETKIDFTLRQPVTINSSAPAS